MLNILSYFFRVFRLCCCCFYVNNRFLTNEYSSEVEMPLSKDLIVEPSSIASWNVCGLSLYLDKKTISDIVDTILYKFDCDILCLQECFDDELINFIVKNTSSKYWYYQSGTLNKKMIIGENSGLLILSKIPIKFLSFNYFKNNIGAEHLSNKGYLVCSIGGINIVNTHLQSSDCNIFCGNVKETIEKQIRQLRGDSSATNTIYCGDFNTELVGTYFDISLDYQKSTLNEKMTNKNQTLDYIITRDPTIELTVEVLDIDDNPSDHKPVLSQIIKKT